MNTAPEPGSPHVLQLTLDALTSHVAVLDENGKIILVNKAWRQFAEQNEGTAASYEVGAHYLQVCEEATAAWSTKAWSEAAASLAQGIREVIALARDDFSLEYCCCSSRHNPQEERWFKVDVTRFISEAAVRVVLAHENITQRQKAEERLRRSEANLAKSQEIARLGSWEIDLRQLNEVEVPPLSWSEETFRLFGYEPGQVEASRENFLSVVHPDEREQVRAMVFQAILQGKYLSFDHRILLPDGTERVVHEQAEIVFDERTAKPLKMVGTVQDITERNRAEEALRESEVQFRTIAEAMPQIIWVTRPDGWHTHFNQRWMDYTGLTLEESLGHGWNPPFHPEDRPRAAKRWQQAIESGEPYETEYRLRRADGTYRWMLGRALPMRDATGAVVKWFGTCTDIHDLKLAEEQISHSNREQRELAQQLEKERSRLVAAQRVAKVGSWELDFATNMLTWSDENYRIFGVERDKFAVTYKAFLELIPPGDRAAVDQAYTDLVASRMPYTIDHRLQMEDGSLKIVHERCETFYDDQGQPLRSTQDITEQKQAQEQLRSSEERFQNIVANVPGMVYQFARHLDGSFTWPFVSDGCRGMFQVEPESIKSNPNLPMDMIHPDDQAEFKRSMMAAKEALLPWSWEGRLRMPSGKTKWVQGASHPQPLPEGGTVCTGLLLDVTARKEAEAERDRFFAMSLDMLSIAGFDGCFKRLNPAFLETLGYTEAELRGRPSLELVHPADQAATLAARNKLMAGEIVAGLENRYRSKDGSWRWLEWKSVAAVEEGVVYAAARDVSARKKAEAALQKANDELELHVMERTAELATANEQLGAANEALRVENIEHEMTMAALRQAAEAFQRAKEEADKANAAKSEFLSRMSHELRTPLNAILGFGQVLEMSRRLQDRDLQAVEHILKGGRHLLDLINEVLDIARVEAGRFEISLEPLVLKDVVAEVCALMQPLATERSIRLDQNLLTLGQSPVLADRQRLKQVLLNLLSNAIKYNREGGQVQVFQEDKANGRTSLSVRDTGPGIAPQDLPKLFTPFERLSAANSAVEGTGLGLVLSQRLVTAMGGELYAQSTLGHGTTFTVDLLQSTSPQEQLTDAPEGTRQLNIGHTTKRTYCVLCVEDNPSNLRLLEIIFESRPEIRMLAAVQGGLALDLARQHQPDLILLDLNLPDIHGREVLTRLQQSAATRDIPVVVVTADAIPHQRELLLAEGARAYLTKPLDVRELFRTLDAFFQVED